MLVLDFLYARYTAGMTSLSLAQIPQSPPSQPPAVTIPIEVMVLGGVGLAIALFKWLLGQQLNHWQTLIKSNEVKIDEQQDKAILLSSRCADLEKQLQQLAEAATPSQALQRDFDLLRQRFENISQAFIDLQKLYQESQKDLLRMRTELSDSYVRREDWIRFGTTLEAKMDQLNRKIDEQRENLILKLANKHDEP